MDKGCEGGEGAKEQLGTVRGALIHPWGLELAFDVGG